MRLADILLDIFIAGTAGAALGMACRNREGLRELKKQADEDRKRLEQCGDGVSPKNTGHFDDSLYDVRYGEAARDADAGPAFEDDSSSGSSEPGPSMDMPDLDDSDWQSLPSLNKEDGKENDVSHDAPHTAGNTGSPSACAHDPGDGFDFPDDDFLLFDEPEMMLEQEPASPKPDPAAANPPSGSLSDSDVDRILRERHTAIYGSGAFIASSVPVRCKNTGKGYISLNDAARKTGDSFSSIRKSIATGVPTARNNVFAKMSKEEYAALPDGMWE